MLTYLIFYFLISFSFYTSATNSEEYCEISSSQNEECKSSQSHFSNKRYIFYDINPAEGFNLRRDVYVRVATFIKHLQQDKEYRWYLVLPPWGNLYHWRSISAEPQKQLPWGLFFDIKSLRRYIPVLEMYEFIKEFNKKKGNTVLDCIYYLQNDEEMFKTGIFKDKNIVTKCEKSSYQKKNNGEISGYFWSYSNITAREIYCVIFHGTVLNLKKNLKPDLYRTFMFDHMEIPLHFTYGSEEYWKARRSMRYNSNLYKIALEFRSKYLSSNDLDDRTIKHEDWRLDKKQRNALGGPYLAVHFRRQDFLFGRKDSSPTVKDAALQIKGLLKLLNLDVVFISTDAKEEYIKLKNELQNYNVFRYVPTESVITKFKDGGVAVIDQIISSHARYFIGTHESTFTFRIQEDREILGFPANTTFNVLCCSRKCFSVNKWEIIWD